MSEDGKVHEIVIIKRHGGGHEDGHHGGAWKIAYADFVTAMMAFFLVMWLVSANDKTKASIARYFNPVLLVDSTPQPPGLTDPKPGASTPKTSSAPDSPAKDPQAKPTESKQEKPTPSPQNAKGASAGETAQKTEADLFRDPYAVLADIAEKEKPQPTKPTAKDSESAKGGPGKGLASGTKGGAAPSGSAGQKGGEAFRDPFEPQASGEAGLSENGVPADKEPLAADVTAGARSRSDDVADTAPLPADPEAKAAELRNRIAALMKSVDAGSSQPTPNIDVKVTPEGILVALTDDSKFAMFASASAEPSPKTVLLMAKIGKLLKAQKGRIVVRGFTDSRKFKSDVYDNWRLSSERADMAHYMLVRGGLDDARFERVEGYADRQPRNTKDPESPDNRRIEILLREAP